MGSGPFPARIMRSGPAFVHRACKLCVDNFLNFRFILPIPGTASGYSGEPDMTLMKKDFLINVSVGVVCVGFGFGLGKVLNDPTGERSHNFLTSTESSSYQNELTVEEVHGGVEEVISRSRP